MGREIAGDVQLIVVLSGLGTGFSNTRSGLDMLLQNRYLIFTTMCECEAEDAQFVIRNNAPSGVAPIDA